MIVVMYHGRTNGGAGIPLRSATHARRFIADGHKLGLPRTVQVVWYANGRPVHVLTVPGSAVGRAPFPPGERRTP